MTQEQVLQQIRAERALQDARWGPPADRRIGNASRLAILLQQVGHVAECINKLRHGDATLTHNALEARLKEELIRCAAETTAWLEVLP